MPIRTSRERVHAHVHPAKVWFLSVGSETPYVKQIFQVFQAGGNKKV